MAPSRKTRSGRQAPLPPAKRVRTKGGCLTCRIRRKKCDESRDHEGGCETCSRLHIQCLGYSTKRPDWLKGRQVDALKSKIKHFLADHNAKSSSRSLGSPFLWLHTDPIPPQHSDSGDSDSDLDSEEDVKPEMTYAHPPSSPELTMPVLDSTYDWMALPELQLIPANWYPADSWSINYNSPGSLEDAEGSLYHEEFMPSLMDPTLSPMPMNEPHGPSYLLPIDNLQVMESAYTHVNEWQTSRPLWGSFFALTRLTSSVDPRAVQDVLDNDPEGVSAVLDAFPARGNLAELACRRQAAMRHLSSSGYNKFESRTVTLLWMMSESLSCGDYSLWGECLDFVLSWVHDRLTGQADLAIATPTERVCLKHGIWADLVAGATTKRHPLNIELYRKVLATAETPILDCPNKVTLALAESVALAAHPDQLPRASKKLDQLRADLVSPSDTGPLDEYSIKARIHTAGARLYLEIVANDGAPHNPKIQQAVDAVCTLVSEQDQQRDFAFWIFLAGCHTVDNNRWPNCSMMMDMLVGGGRDVALEAASAVMNEVHTARLHGNVPADLWRVQMERRSALLV